MHSGFDEFIFLFTYSNSLITKYPELPFEIVARTFVLFSDKLSRNSCISRKSDLNTRMSGRILESYANYVWTRGDLSSLQPTDRQQLFVFIIQLHEVECKLRSNRVKLSGDIVQLFIRCRKKEPV